MLQRNIQSEQSIEIIFLSSDSYIYNQSWLMGFFVDEHNWIDEGMCNYKHSTFRVH